MTSETNETILEVLDFLQILACELKLGQGLAGMAMEDTPRTVAVKAQVLELMKERAPSQAALRELKKRRALIQSYPPSPQMERIVERLNQAIVDLQKKPK